MALLEVKALIGDVPICLDIPQPAFIITETEVSTYLNLQNQMSMTPGALTHDHPAVFSGDGSGLPKGGA